ncbi:RraA family protein [Yanshouia hominis]|uniref:Putative 4-hydroxy-4-methyl-2-oxoglutarate aldolase n=1 Tax=Yanshouia hominis TaxID=2763673 RepID=A0ABR7NMD2_9FIRM|nr:RraA family protein [Yanshouia hominis]MBC8577469.1 RraA family protein [Yanshouia hominis]
MLDENVRKFYESVQTGVVTDAMYLLGLEGWMTDVFPLRPEKRIFGKAFTVQAVRIREKGEPNYTIYDLSEKWEAGDILVVDAFGENCSLMGENIAHTCMYGGLNGVVLNGRCRDFGQISELEMPVFGKGPAMELKNKRFKYGMYQVTLANMAGAQVRPGDYILGDVDGVLVIPSDRLEDIMYQAEMIIEVENEMEDAIRNRCSVAEVKAIASKKKKARA